MTSGTPALSTVSGAAVAGYLDALGTEITRHAMVADRVWAWAYVAHALAIIEITEVTETADTAPDVRGADVGSPSPGGSGSTAAVWVSPQMSWAMDDLVDAGIRVGAPTLPPVDAASRAGVIAGALRRMVVTADISDDSAPMLVQDAVRAAGRRAVLAHEAYAGPLP